MTQTKTCERCGAVVPTSGAMAGLCPKCMLRAGMAGGTAGPGAWEPPPLARLAEEFPQLELLELVGRGGMGAVYRARQPGLDRVVALKVLPDEIGDDAAFAERFEREARLLARLDHPSIVRVHDAGRAGKRWFFLMEFVDGTTLRQLIRSGEVAPEQALSIVTQICDALQYAHDQGVVHRDIKPENVLVDTTGRVKIADFGLAKIVGGAPEAALLTRSDQAMGTMHYMAPEQLRRPLAVDHRADIYSLGVVFYELLTGEVPVGHFPPPSAAVAVDVRLDEVVLKSLAREPEQRYQRADDVSTAVHGLGEPAGAAVAAGAIAAAASGKGGAGGRRADGEGAVAPNGERSKTPGWIWLVVGCVAIPFALSLLGLLLGSALFLSTARVEPQPQVASTPIEDDASSAPVEAVRAPEPDPSSVQEPVRTREAEDEADRIETRRIPESFFQGGLFRWERGGLVLREELFVAAGVEPAVRQILDRAVRDAWTAYRELEREATTVVRAEPGHLVLEIDEFQEELIDELEELGRVFEAAADSVGDLSLIVPDQALPFGREPVRLELLHEEGRAVITATGPDDESQRLVGDSMPESFLRFFEDAGVPPRRSE